MVILYAMKRPIHLRPLTDVERETLDAGLRSSDAFTLHRCQRSCSPAQMARTPSRSPVLLHAIRRQRATLATVSPALP
jgi:hypothetical protein